MQKTTDKTPPTTFPERDKEREYEFEQWIELATLLAQCELNEPIDTDE